MAKQSMRRFVPVALTALQASANGHAGAVMLALGNDLGAIPLIASTVGLTLTVCLLIRDCAEARALAAMIGLMAVLASLLAVTIGLPGREPIPLTTAVALVALLNALAVAAAVMVPRRAALPEPRPSATYHR